MCKTKRFTKNIFAITAAAALALAPVNVSAVSQDETVYAKLHSNGELDYISVTEHLINDQKEKKLTTTSLLQDIENLNGFEQFSFQNNILIWETEGKDIYFSGTSTQDLPIKLDVTYQLNGTTYPAEDILGKSGKVEIKLKYTNLSKIGNLYTPFVIAVATTLPESTTHNLTVTNGKVSSNGRNLAIAAVAAPGLYESLQLDELKSLDEITIAYETDNFELSDIYSAVTPKVLDNEDLKVFSKLDDLYQDTDQLSSGSRELVNGTDQLYQGIKTMRDALVQASQKFQLAGNAMTPEILSQIETAASSAAREKVAAEQSTIRSQIHQQVTTLPELQKLQSLQASLKPFIERYVTNEVTIQVQNYCKIAENTAACADPATLAQIQTQITQTVSSQVAGQFNISFSTSGIEEKLFQTIYSNMQQAAQSTAAATARSVATQVADSIQAGYSTQITTMLNTMMAGVDQLMQGAGDLNAGMQKFDREGIQTLSNFVNNTVRTTSNKLENLTKLADEYNNYAGIGENMTGTTKFVMMIEGMKK